jgi:D-ribose pyranase
MIMRRNGILNQDILAATGGLGHSDYLVICDAGLPIPLEVDRIDLSITRNVPRVVDVLRPILAEVIFEKIILAEEMQKASPALLAQIRELAGSIPIEFISQAEFKLRTHDARAIIRTGEHTPFGNVMLQSGVEFD